MTKRTAKKVVSNVSVEQFNDALSSYASADAREQNIISKMDEQIIKIREKYQDELTRLSDQKKTDFEVVYTYCDENGNLFEKRKSFDTPHGVVGFRTGTPKLKPIKGFTFAASLNLAKLNLPNYVRVKEEINKEGLLLDRDKADVKIALPSIGLEVVQDETFFIDLKKEDVLV